MKRLACSLLFTGLSLSGAAVAQERYAEEYARTHGAQGQGYLGQPIQGYQQRGDIPGATYDYARVLRVDPVIGRGYRGQTASGGQNCQYRQADDVYARDGYYGNDRYGSRNDGYYGNDRYGSRNDGYYGNDRYGSRNDGYYGNDRYGSRNDGYYGNDRYGSRNDGYYGGNDGYRDARGGETGRTIATVVGGIAGAVLGSKVGEGSGQYVGTAIGSMVGGMAGRSIYENSQRNRQVTRGTVTVCDPIPVGSRTGSYGNGNGYYSGNENLEGYDVTYEYNGRSYQTRTDYHPGDRIRVRVDVRPD
jgi:uncharacterized protein YcfJ